MDQSKCCNMLSCFPFKKEVKNLKKKFDFLNVLGSNFVASNYNREVESTLKIFGCKIEEDEEQPLGMNEQLILLLVEMSKFALTDYDVIQEFCKKFQIPLVIDKKRSCHINRAILHQYILDVCPL